MQRTAFAQPVPPMKSLHTIRLQLLFAFALMLCLAVAGGEVVATGTPEAIVRVKASHTGRFLGAHLRASPSKPTPPPKPKNSSPG